MKKNIALQHSPSPVAAWIKNVYGYKQVRYGNIKKGEGDIVIIGLNDYKGIGDIQEYLLHTLHIDRIETKGIYTNVFFSGKFFELIIQDILK